MAAPNNPLSPINRLFEFAVWPFQAAAEYEAKRQPLSDQRYSSLLLMPALFLFIPLCLLVSLVAIAYVFFVLPFLVICQSLDRLFPDR